MPASINKRTVIIYYIFKYLFKLFFTAKTIAPRNHLKHRGIVFHTQELHTFRFHCGPGGFGYSGSIPGRDKYGRRGVRRNSDIHRKLVALAFPVADDLAVGRLVTALDPVDTLDDAGSQCEMLEPGIRRIWQNSAKPLDRTTSQALP